jgi:hypothetical protein
MLDLDRVSWIEVTTTAVEGGFALAATYWDAQNHFVGMQNLLSVTEAGLAGVGSAALLPTQDAAGMRLLLSLAESGVVTFSKLTVTTPEPGTLPLLLSGLLALAWRARHRR